MGSNGKDPATNSSGSSYHVLLPTNNFAELLSFGAVATSNSASNTLLGTNYVFLTGTNKFNGAVAPQMGLSVGLSHGVVLSVLQRAHVGAPFISHHSTHDLSSTGGQICSQLQPAARPPA
jgi:hypothetical protein